MLGLTCVLTNASLSEDKLTELKDHNYIQWYM